MYDKIITPTFEQIGKRKHLIGYTGELYDGQILLHSQSYDTNSQAEQALDRIVYELLTDLADQGLVDDVPAALEAEHVSSTHLPSWQGVCSEPDNHCELHDPCPAHAADAARYLAEQSYGLGAIVEHLAYGTGTVIAITDDEHLNVQVKFNQVSRFGRKFWFDRSELRSFIPNDPELSIEAIAAHMASVYVPNWQPASIDDADLPF